MTTTQRAAARVIDAWDSTVLPVANDGRLQEAMEDLRAALAEQAEPVAPQKYDDTLMPFLHLMRTELHANADKGDRPGWLSMDRNTALLEIYWHTAKLSAAVKNNNHALIAEHSADVANMAMMLADVCGVLPEYAPPAPAPTWPEWAEQILKTVREYSGYDGYDDADGVDLPEEVREALEELTAQIERLEAKAPAPARQEWQPPTDFQLEQLFDAVHEHGQFGREFREHARTILVAPAEGGAAALTQPEGGA